MLWFRLSGTPRTSPALKLRWRRRVIAGLRRASLQWYRRTPPLQLHQRALVIIDKYNMAVSEARSLTSTLISHPSHCGCHVGLIHATSPRRSVHANAPQLASGACSLNCAKAYATSQCFETAFDLTGETLGIHIPRPKWPSRLGTIFFCNSAFSLVLRSWETPLYSRFSRGG